MSSDIFGLSMDHDSIINQLESRIGYTFQDRSLAIAALTHSSGANTRGDSNERMEFLGDAVLGFTACEFLFERFPQWQEGQLTQMKSIVVSRKTCAEWAAEIGIEELIIVGKGVGTKGKLPWSLLANALESVVAAVFLDAGLQAAQNILRGMIERKVEAVCELDLEPNYKSILQQLVQKNLGRPPSYVVLEESGPDHDKSFCVCVQISSRKFPSSWGKNKKQAEQRAAGRAVAELTEEDPSAYVIDSVLLPATRRSELSQSDEALPE